MGVQGLITFKDGKLSYGQQRLSSISDDGWDKRRHKVIHKSAYNELLHIFCLKNSLNGIGWFKVIGNETYPRCRAVELNSRPHG